MSTRTYSLLPPNILRPGSQVARPEGLIKIGAAATILGVSQVTIRRRVRDGSLPYVRVCGRLYFRPSELHVFIEAHRGGLGAAIGFDKESQRLIEPS